MNKMPDPTILKKNTYSSISIPMPGGDELSENNATLHNVFFQEGFFVEENKDNYDFASRQTQRTSSKQETDLVVPGY